MSENKISEFLFNLLKASNNTVCFEKSITQYCYVHENNEANYMCVRALAQGDRLGDALRLFEERMLRQRRPVSIEEKFLICTTVICRVN